MISGLCTSTVECPVQAWAERCALGLSQDPVAEAFGSGIWYCMGWGLAQAAAALTKGALGPEAEPPPGWFRMEHSSGQPGTRQCGCFSRRTAVCFGCWGWPEGPRSSWECSHLKKRGILYGLGLCSREWMHSNLLKSFSVSPVCVNSATCKPISV